MPFNGSGTFVRLRNWVNDAASGIKIRADRHDSEDDNFAAGLTQCITKDGQTTITANLPMATYRHTGVGAAAATTDYARADQVRNGSLNWVVAGGTADALTATYTIPTTTLADGQIFHVRATAANTTTTPTLAVDGLTAYTIVKDGGDALAVGDIPGALAECIFRYNLANTRYELLNPASASIADGAITTAKLDDLAVTTGKINDLAVTTGKIADDAVTLAKMASGTAGNLITYDASGDPAAVATGTSGQVLTSNGAGAAPTMQDLPASGFTLGTEQATTSGASFTFSSIPSGTKQIIINFDGVSLSGTDNFLVQLNVSATPETSGYNSLSQTIGAANATSTAGFVIRGAAGTSIITGTMVLTLANSSSNKWVETHVTSTNAATNINAGWGVKSLAGVLDGVKLLATGSDTFDAGAVNIQYIG